MSDTPAGSARGEILARVRKQLGVRGDEPGRRGSVQSRLRQPEANLIPARAKKPRNERIKLFQTMLETSGAEVTRVRTYKALTEALATFLRDRNLPAHIRVGNDPLFAGLLAAPGIVEFAMGAADGSDAVSLSNAFTAAAETGTLFLLSGPDNPSTLNFLPETHCVTIVADKIEGSYEDCWARIRSLGTERELPRTVNMISGPSRTADIEQTIVLGAHGPKRLAVFIVGV